MQFVCCPRLLARLKDGRSIAANTAMMAITTNSSINVKAWRDFGGSGTNNTMSCSAPSRELWRATLARKSSSHLPRRTERPGQQLTRLRVADDHFLGRVPLDFAAHHHRNESQVPGNSRVMRGLDGRNRRFARLYAIQKVPLMIFGPIKLHLVFLLRNTGEQIHI